MYTGRSSGGISGGKRCNMKTQYKSCDSLSGSEDQLLNATKKLDVATNTCQSLDKDVLV